MFAYLRGTLIEATLQEVVLDVHGIGYLLIVPISVLTHLPTLGSEVTLHTTLIVREDAHTLYGFHSKQERTLFLLFLGISGVGPKTALSIVGHLETVNVLDSIREHNVQALCRIPGIGKKTAERIILEVKDKLSSTELHIDSFALDATNALINLGYSQATAQKAVSHSLKSLDTPNDLAHLITVALKNCK